MPDVNTHTFDTPPVYGQHVTGTSHGVRDNGSTYDGTFSGTYLGIVRSDHDGALIHLFVDGDINGIAQPSHGFPATAREADVGARALAALPGSTAAVIAWREAHGPTGPTGATGGPTGPTGQRREVLIHLNVDVPGWDTRTAEEIASVLMQALYVGLEGAADAGVDAPDPGMVELALAEEA